MAPAEERGTTARAGLLLGGTLTLLVLGTYLPVLGHEFIGFDDLRAREEYQPIRDGLSARGVRWALSTELFSNRVPLTTLSHMLDWELYGDHPRGHYLSNLVLHATAAVAFFAFLLRTTRRPWPSFAAACLFAVHPLRVESVAWIAERKDVLSGALAGLVLLLYAWYAEAPSGRRLTLVSVAFAAGLAAKPMLVTLPVALLLLDVWPLRRQSTGPRLLAEKAPLFALALIASWLALASQADEAISWAAPLSQRLGAAVVGITTYLQKTLWPSGLAVFYPFRVHPLPLWRVAAATAMLAGLTALCLAAARRRPYLAVGWLWFLGTLVPVSGLVQVGEQAGADRYTYLPSWGLALAVAFAAADLSRRGRVSRLAVGCSAALVLVASLVATRQQLAYWRNDETLFRHTAAVTRNNYKAHSILGRRLVARGELDEGTFHLVRALQIAPGKPELYGPVADAFLRQGLAAEAARVLDKGLALARRRPDLHELRAAAAEAEREPPLVAFHRARAFSLAPTEAAARALIEALEPLPVAELAAVLEAALRDGGEHEPGWARLSAVREAVAGGETATP